MPTLLNGTTIPKLVYGTTIKPSNPDDLLFHALSIGFRAFDTASTRKFHREDLDGQQLERALKSNSLTREEIFIQTKFTPSRAHADPFPFDETDDPHAQVQKSMERSLRELRVDVIDVYLMHGPMPSPEETMAVWVAMEMLVTLGKVRYIGLCNVDFSTLARIYDAATNVRRFCAAHGIVYEIFGVLGAANLELLDLPIVKTFAGEKGCTVQEVLLRLVLASAAEDGLEGCILTGTSKLERMGRDLEVVSNGESLERVVLEEFRGALGKLVNGS
ncbi:Aldo/keto reductase [Wilcoxina mikolae CBS 423.85]|nr:Aldo/keto reductase [Wilcoxina mikolae CBS 423.85]